MAGVTVIKPRRFDDEREWFPQAYSRNAAGERRLFQQFIKDNHLLSRQAGTSRGPRFQYARAKLDRCPNGRIFDYVINLRRGLPASEHHLPVELKAEHGLVTLSTGRLRTRLSDPRTFYRRRLRGLGRLQPGL